MRNGDCPTCAVSGLERAPLFSQRARAPYKADLALTYGCNNECPHCYNEADRHSHGHMRLEDGKRIIDRLVEVGVPFTDPMADGTTIQRSSRAALEIAAAGRRCRSPSTN